MALLDGLASKSLFRRPRRDARSDLASDGPRQLVERGEIERVLHPSPQPVGLDEFRPAQHLHVMGQQRGRHSEVVDELAGAPRAGPQRVGDRPADRFGRACNRSTGIELTNSSSTPWTAREGPKVTSDRDPVTARSEGRVSGSVSQLITNSGGVRPALLPGTSPTSSGRFEGRIRRAVRRRLQPGRACPAQPGRCRR